MKTLLQTLFGTLFLSTFIPTSVHAQGLIVNELSNGGAGTKEYIELLVVGSATKKIGTVDLSNWIIDDNGGGALSPNISDVGIANGHVRLSASCFSNIPIGSIIIIYNADDLHVNLPAPDIADSNNDNVYVIPHNSTCLEYCSSLPSSGNNNYGLPNCNNVGYIGNRSWGVMGLSNTNDGFQTRMPNGTLYHALGYGLSSYTPTTPISEQLGGGFALNHFIGAPQYAFAYACGSLIDAANINRINFADATPGAANDAANAILIDNIRNGSFDYTDWSNPDNCTFPLPLHLTSFGVSAKEFQVNLLNWTLVTVDPFSYVEIQRSKDGINFTTIERLPLEATMEERQYTYEDKTPYFTTYYRLKFTEPTAPTSYSEVRVVTHNKVNNNTVLLYPNPTQGNLNITLQEALNTNARFEILDVLGRVVLSGEIPAENNFLQLNTYELEKGNYFFRLFGEAFSTTQKFIKY